MPIIAGCVGALSILFPSPSGSRPADITLGDPEICVHVEQAKNIMGVNARTQDG